MNGSLTLIASLLMIPAVLQMTGDDPMASDPPVIWRIVLKSVENTALNYSVLHLFCLQWAIWLATCRLKTIEELQVRCCFKWCVSAGVQVSSGMFLFGFVM